MQNATRPPRANGRAPAGKRPRTPGYSPWVERGRTACVVCAVLIMATAVLLVASVYRPAQPIGLLKLVEPTLHEGGAQTTEAGLIPRIAADLHGWLDGFVDRPIAITPVSVVYFAASFHAFTAAFLLALVSVGGRRAPPLAFLVTLLLVSAWAAATVAVLVWYGEPVLSHGLMGLYVLALFFVLAGLLSRRASRKAAAASAEASARRAPEPPAETGPGSATVDAE